MATLMNEKELDQFHAKVPLAPRKPVRALALGGGGPAVGISIGFLLAWQEWNRKASAGGDARRVIDFPVWVTGCVGGWLACIYHLGKPADANDVEKAMRKFFRETDMYENFPAPMTFTPNLPDQISAGLAFLADPRSYKNMVVPTSILQAYSDIRDHYLAPSKWNTGDFAYLMLNSVLAPNPAARMLMTMLYKTPGVNGINKLWFDSSYTLLNVMDLDTLKSKALPFIYINSYNIDQHRSIVYCNRSAETEPPTEPISMQALCASSALPYILEPVVINGESHIDGALIDSFCFEAIHERHQDTNEVWISQIVDHTQVKTPTNLLEALNNLIMLYAGTTSRHDIVTFVNEVNRHEAIKRLVKPQHEPELIETLRLPVDPFTHYTWSTENFDNSVRRSKDSCALFIKEYMRHFHDGLRTPQRKNMFVRATKFTGA